MFKFIKKGFVVSIVKDETNSYNMRNNSSVRELTEIFLLCAIASIQSITLTPINTRQFIPLSLLAALYFRKLQHAYRFILVFIFYMFNIEDFALNIPDFA